jgi:hypothetical protein
MSWVQSSTEEKKKKRERMLNFTGSKIIKSRNSKEMVAYTCNPSYSGGRDQKDHGS